MKKKTFSNKGYPKDLIQNYGNENYGKANTES